MSNFNMDNFEDILDKRGLGKSKKVQKKLDKAVIDKSEKYIPMDSGKLINSSSATKIGSGNIQYDADYASAVYKTNKNYNGSPLRGAYWFDRMKTDNVDELRRIAAKESGGEGKK